jgi:hypothetical protein
MRVSSIVASVVALASFASAQTPTGPFTGQHHEDFNNGGVQVMFLPCMPNGVFGGTVQMCTPTGSGCHTTGAWGYACFLPNYSSGWMFGSAGGEVEFTFSPPATKFGGYFGINSGIPDGTFEFYDVGNNLLASVPVTIPADCTWNWLGWQIPQGASRIVVASNHSSNGYILMDELELDTAPVNPTPTVYCTPGTTTNGCLGSISASANPVVAHSAPCQLSVSGVEGQKSGILFYGLAQNIQPWCSIGGNSFLCVKAPTQRTIAQPSGGTFGACDGTFALDWNAWQLANGGALGQPFAAGDKVYVQGWFRDPPACKTTNMTDAIELTYLP